ncbi:MAG TPA: hypothetical protein ENN32_06300, partial [Chloroflexi bacterium]|nr:hypothetical protein [Chloroflexota bacterium]
MAALHNSFNHVKAEIWPAWLITRREVKDQFRDWRVVFPIVFLTAFFPYLMNYAVRQMLNFVEQYG